MLLTEEQKRKLLGIYQGRLSAKGRSKGKGRGRGTGSGGGRRENNAPPTISGGVFGWGSINNGVTQIPPTTSENVVKVVATSDGGAALFVDGHIEAWGNISSIPVGAQGNNISDLAAGNSHIIALLDDGTIVTWGTVVGTQPPEASSNVSAIGAGNDSSFVVVGGRVYYWGASHAFTSTKDVPASAQSNVVAVTGGSRSAIALKDDGTCVVWGNDARQQLTNIPAGALTDIKQISTYGGNSFITLNNSGQVFSWGEDSSGQRTVPVEAQSGIISIGNCGVNAANTIYALKSDGGLVQWGITNEISPLLDPNATSGVIDFAVSRFFVLAIKP